MNDILIFMKIVFKDIRLNGHAKPKVKQYRERRIRKPISGMKYNMKP